MLIFHSEASRDSTRAMSEQLLLVRGLARRGLLMDAVRVEVDLARHVRRNTAGRTRAGARATTGVPSRQAGDRRGWRGRCVLPHVDREE